MWRFAVNRLFIIFLTLFFLSIFLFFLVRIIPGSPEMVILLQRGGIINTEELTNLREELGHNTSLFNQYIGWAMKMIRFDFGASYQSNLPVVEEIFSRINGTLLLAGPSLAISTLAGIIISFYATLYNGSRWDKWIGNISIFLSSLPNYLVGLLLVLIFSIHWKITPVYGNDTWLHFILPIVTASLSLSAVFVQLFRQIIGEVIESLYFEAARARGLKNVVLYSRTLYLPCIHGFLTVIAANIGSLWGSIIVIETTFAWPGIGNYIIHAVSVRDYPVIIGFTLIMALFTMLIYLIIDMLLRYIDPRQKWKERGREW